MQGKATWLALAVVLAAASAQAQWPPGFGAPVAAAPTATVGPTAEGAGGALKARLIPSHTTAAPGQSLHLAVSLELAPDHYLYGPVPRQSGHAVEPIPLVIDVGPSKLSVGKPMFLPTTTHQQSYDDQGTDVYNVYESPTTVYLPVAIPADLPAGDYDLPVRVKAQVCLSIPPFSCLLPLDVQLSATIRVGPHAVASEDWAGPVAAGLAQAKPVSATTAPSTQPSTAAKPARTAAQLTIAAGLGLAFLAGLLLNVMPCVLPVVPLKVLSIFQHARESRHRFIWLGLAFVAGILLFFVAIVTVNVILRVALSHTLGWGDQFRQPAFVIGMFLLLVGMAANLFGAFTVLVPGRVASVQDATGFHGALGMGFVTGLLSTPCSFGILTSALGWAQSQPLWLGSSAIMTIGLGMAAPYGLLTAFPRMVRFVPQAGRWTELFERSMGFVLLLVAVWLLGSLSTDAYTTWVAAYAVILAFCLWMVGSWVRYDGEAWKKWTVRAVALALAVAAGIWMLSPRAGLAVKFEPYDAARIAAARHAGQTVLVDYTAEWCLTCKTVEQRVYSDKAIAKLLADRNILPIRGDTSRDNLPATAELKRMNQAIPVTALYPPGDGPPILLPGLFSKADLIEALDKIAPPP